MNLTFSKKNFYEEILHKKATKTYRSANASSTSQHSVILRDMLIPEYEKINIFVLKGEESSEEFQKTLVSFT